MGSCNHVAICLLFQKSGAMPGGGMLTPASAFAHTSYQHQLEEAGIQFDIVARGRL